MQAAIQILGTGECLPATRVASSDLDRRWNKPTGWTRKHSGIDGRYFAGADETSSRMAARAARQALDEAGLRADELDLIVSACSVMEQPIPCTGALVQRELGLQTSGIPAFDVNATCLSFLMAVDLVATMIVAGRYRRVLVVSSEIASAGLPWDDPATAMLFGDGAMAAVLAPSPDRDAGVLAAHFETYSEGAEFCQIRAGGTRLRLHEDAEDFARGAVFRMDGRATYKIAAQRLPAFLDRLLTRAGVDLDAIAAIVPHQASDKALRHLQAALALPDDKLVRVLPERGNQMAASVGVALHHARTSGRVRRGDVVALVGSGAGLSFGGVVLRL
jgi:3-oxoacyl-[acyl-carrier-protein] synthase-3